MSVSGFHDSANKPLQLLALVPIQYIKMTIQTPIAMRELHRRVSDGIHVRLLWGEGDGQLSVSVTDTRTGSAFCLELSSGPKMARQRSEVRVCKRTPQPSRSSREQWSTEPCGCKVVAPRRIMPYLR